MTLYNFSVQIGNEESVPNVCANGYIKNASNTAIASFVIYSEKYATLKKTLSPQQAFNFTNLYIQQILNTSTDASCVLEVVFSDSGAFSATEGANAQSILNNLNASIIGVDPNVTFAVSGTVNATIASVAAGVNFNVSGTVNAAITSIGSTIVMPVSGSVTATISGTADINIASIASGVSFDVSGSTVNATIASIASGVNFNVSGTVNAAITSIGSTIVMPVSGSVSATISGTADINIAANTVGNITVDLAAQTVGNIATDIGSFTQNLEENQVSNTNQLTYNPWKFSLSVIPSIRQSAFNSAIMCNIQENGANGYPTFYFLVYNPTSSSASANITVYLYDRLPLNPLEPPINQFTFNSGTIAANSGAWITVNPNINWQYNTLVVIPQSATGTSGNAIGIAYPYYGNFINSHYWNGAIWTQSDWGFIGFWSWTNSPPASMPVAITSPVKITEGTPSNSIQINVTANTPELIVPNGKKWKILRTWLTGVSSGVSPLQVSAYIIPNGFPTSVFLFENLAYIDQSSPASGDTYYGLGTIMGNINLTFGLGEQAQTWNDYPVLYAGDRIFIYSNNATAINIYLSYVESDI